MAKINQVGQIGGGLDVRQSKANPILVPPVDNHYDKIATQLSDATTKLEESYRLGEVSKYQAELKAMEKRLHSDINDPAIDIAEMKRRRKEGDEAIKEFQSEFMYSGYAEDWTIAFESNRSASLDVSQAKSMNVKLKSANIVNIDVIANSENLPDTKMESIKRIVDGNIGTLYSKEEAYMMVEKSKNSVWTADTNTLMAEQFSVLGRYDNDGIDETTSEGIKNQFNEDLAQQEARLNDSKLSPQATLNLTTALTEQRNKLNVKLKTLEVKKVMNEKYDAARSINALDGSEVSWVEAHNSIDAMTNKEDQAKAFKDVQITSNHVGLNKLKYMTNDIDITDVSNIEWVKAQINTNPSEITRAAMHQSLSDRITIANNRANGSSANVDKIRYNVIKANLLRLEEQYGKGLISETKFNEGLNTLTRTKDGKVIPSLSIKDLDMIEGFRNIPTKRTGQIKSYLNRFINAGEFISKDAEKLNLGFMEKGGMGNFNKHAPSVDELKRLHDTVVKFQAINTRLTREVFQGMHPNIVSRSEDNQLRLTAEEQELLNRKTIDLLISDGIRKFK